MQEGKKETVMYLRNFLSAKAGPMLLATETAHSRLLPSQMPCVLWGPGNLKKKSLRIGKKRKKKTEKIRGGHEMTTRWPLGQGREDPSCLASLF